jgi:DNA-binding XRE family transcriptional regulator
VKLDQSAIARIEQGDRFVLDLEAIAIAKVFKVPVERLFVRKAL